jgi:GGDEF domain-containing protein
MLFHRTIAYHSAHGRTPPSAVTRLVEERDLQIAKIHNGRELDQLVNQSFPACIVIDADGSETSISVCRSLKRDPFTAIIPVVILATSGEDDFLFQALEAGADEVLTYQMKEREQLLRLGTALDRASRDVSVHPTTRLPGTGLIERDLADRLRRKELFAVCYADLDHFKEFNDRYGYNEGDGVIVLLSRILRDVVKGRAPDGFIGHIGGDDFIFTVPIEVMRICCEEVLEIFDQLIPYQYSEDDRRTGYFLGKDRRGNVLRIPLMTLSIGVVTNQHRTFTHTARISELATEMKSYAKTLSGSVYAVDRRHDARSLTPAGALAESLPHSLEQ